MRAPGDSGGPVASWSLGSEAHTGESWYIGPLQGCTRHVTRAGFPVFWLSGIAVWGVPRIAVGRGGERASSLFFGPGSRGGPHARREGEARRDERGARVRCAAPDGGRRNVPGPGHGAPGVTRTRDTRFRKPVLYPPELLGRTVRGGRRLARRPQTIRPVLQYLTSEKTGASARGARPPSSPNSIRKT